LSTSDVPGPATNIPSNDEFFFKGNMEKPDLDFIKKHFYREGRISEEQALAIISKGSDILRKEGTLLEIEAPITSMFVYVPYTQLVLAEYMQYQVPILM
jgi:serine/threonine-protein phosphatase 2B catalytic subunit